MKWDVTTPPAEMPVTLSLVKAQIRVSGTAEDALLQQYIAAATDYAQEQLAGSLVDRTLTATFYADDIGYTPPPATIDAPQGLQAIPIARPFYGEGGRGPMLQLQRGPVRSITSVTDGNGNATSAYSLERKGRADRLRLLAAVTFPITVVYVAGYGAAADVPAGLKQAILCHVGTLYENRESISEKSMVAVPQSLADFYAQRSRRPKVS